MSNEYSDTNIIVNQEKATALAEALSETALAYVYAHDLNKLEVYVALMQVLTALNDKVYM